MLLPRKDASVQLALLPVLNGTHYVAQAYCHTLCSCVWLAALDFLFSSTMQAESPLLLELCIDAKQASKKT